MIGEVFQIEEIDEYGQLWIRKRWPIEDEGNLPVAFGRN